jgi:hypothetical protein
VHFGAAAGAGEGFQKSSDRLQASLLRSRKDKGFQLEAKTTLLASNAKVQLLSVFCTIMLGFIVCILFKIKAPHSAALNGVL